MSTDLIEGLNDHQMHLVRTVIRAAQRKAARNAARNVETGLVDRLPGEDADAVRAFELERVLEQLGDASGVLPTSFLAPLNVRSPGDLLDGESMRERAERASIAEADRDAAEALADVRGAFLVRTLPMIDDVATPDDDETWGQICADAADLARELREHLHVTGEIDADD